MEENEQAADTTQKKKNRHRKKKHIYDSILKQMEFYYSDATLSKDRFLGRLILQDPWVPLETFLKFNKIKALTDKTADIAKALQDSTKLELSEDGLKIKRKHPLCPYDADSRTVYVESIPCTAELPWLREIFQVYGEVAYISLPKFRDTDRIKGFAFVEFEKPQDAEKCLEAFASMNCRLPTNIKADMLSSSQGVQIEIPNTTEALEAKKEELIQSSNDTPKEEASQEPPPKKSRKRKLSDRQADLPIKSQDEDKPRVIAEADPIKEIPQECVMDHLEETGEVEISIESGGPKKKKLRKKKKKDKKKPNKEREKKRLEGAAHGLQVLSKKEWKVLRNQYLTLQRKQFSVLKQVLRTQHTVPQHRAAAAANIVEVAVAEQPTEAVEAEIIPVIPFTPGVIVRARLAQPCVDVKELKRATKTNIHVKHVDIKEGDFQFHVRLDDAVAAQQMASSSIFPEAQVLVGDEEQYYWKEIWRQHGERPKRKERGRDRLLHRAMQGPMSTNPSMTTNPPLPTNPSLPGKHLRFDE